MGINSRLFLLETTGDDENGGAFFMNFCKKCARLGLGETKTSCPMIGENTLDVKLIALIFGCRRYSLK